MPRVLLAFEPPDGGVPEAARQIALGVDVHALISRADLMVLSSDSEGLSVAARAAIAAGGPVVSRDAR